MEEGQANLVSSTQVDGTCRGMRKLTHRSSTVKKDAQGNEHLLMHFNVQGPRGSGLVNMHLVKRVGRSEYEYKYFFVDARGHQRIYLENADAAKQKGSEKGRSTTVFGIKWT